MKRKYARQLDWALDRPKLTMLIAPLIFGATLLLVPFIGGEFMPHLDEGALWVRATMPYTISFEEASKIAPQIRDILMSYPQVTVVGSELGRPDDGTDPTGFFNCEFYVGLKPYKDKAWSGDTDTKAKLIESINKKLTAFPGIIFNYTQPAEDAVDEALTGLKSSLAVKIYGDDLNVLQDKAIQIKNTLAKVPGFTDLTVVRELGQPSLLIDVDRDKIARYGINVADVEAVISAAVGGQAVTQVIQGEKLFDLVVRMQPQFRSSAHEIGESAGRHARREADSAQPTRQHPARAMARHLFIARTTPATSACSTASKAAIWSAPCDDGQKAVEQSRRSAAGLSAGLGRRVQPVSRSQSAADVHRPAGGRPHLHDPVRAVRELQVPGHHRAGRDHDRTGGRAARAETDAHAVQRFLRPGTAGAAGRLGRDRGHSRLLHQQASAGRHGHPHRYAGGLAAAACVPS